MGMAIINLLPATKTFCSKIGGDKVKQVIKVKNGIQTEDAKKIVKVTKLQQKFFYLEQFY
jgi:uncharacterized protein YajQ (UPF0234 family)